MSSYLNFFIRNKNKFLPIGSFCRSSEIYQLGSILFAPYEKVKPLTRENIRQAIDCCDSKIKEYKTSIQCIRSKISFLMGCNDSLEVKLENYECYLESIQEYKEEIEDITYAKDYFITLDCILDDVEYCSDFDCSKYIYFGIEAGYNTITEKDIIREKVS